MRTVFLILLLLVTVGKNGIAQSKKEEKNIDAVLNAWHRAAAESKLETYFSMMSKDMIFMGTDATEHWNRDAFYAFCKPWFDKGKAWNFKAVQRHVYVQHGNAFACFDELLDTHYSICRGSGMLRKEKGQWKLVQYVLSMTVPNDRIKETVAIKKELEKNVLDSLKTLKQNLNE
ncbi:MAG TPA: nuclear transport factor 2 family protein [Chitinophagaceae bacterium]|nr:nuclear transport factor 2 family protein [Chitinophagaceae bacterium]